MQEGEPMAVERQLRAGPRQRQVMALLARGQTDLQIAFQLGISVATVRTYLVRLYKDNGFGNRTEAAVAWLQSQSASGADA
jgi:DNA-binding NarL/FixJ family response regulator